MIAFDLAAARTWLAYNNKDDSSTRAIAIYDKIANDANLELRRAGKWDFDKRSADQLFQAPYSTGTAAVSADGTAVTGTGTTFTSAMVGRYIRFGSETLTYKIATYVSATSITIEAYRGTAALTASTFVVGDARPALPSRFRDFAWPIGSNASYPVLYPKTLEEITMLRRVEKATGTPYYYAVEWAEASSVPTPYMWVYPEPSARQVIRLPHYVWPAEMSTGTDVFYAPYEAQSVIREFMLALLYREQGDVKKYQTQLVVARQEAVSALASFRSVSESGRRDEWSPEGDPSEPDSYGNQIFPASGEPLYT